MRALHEVDGLREVDQPQPPLPPQRVVGRQIGVDEARLGHEPDARAQLLPCVIELGLRQARLREPGRSLHLVADVLEQQPTVIAMADREGHARARLPHRPHDLVLMAEPLLLDELLAVPRHALDRAAVAASPAVVAAVAVHDVVAEGDTCRP